MPSWLIHFLSSELWAGVSGIAQVLSLFAIALALYEYIVRSRAISVALLAHCPGVAVDDASGKKFYVVEVLNAGGQLAIITRFDIINGALAQRPTFMFDYSLQAGDKTRFLVEAEDPKSVWFRWEWIRPQDGRFEYAAWRPMLNGDQTAISRQWDESNERSASKWNPLGGWIDRHPRAVLPDRAAFSRMRVGRSQKTYAKRRGMMVPEVDAFHWRLGLMDPDQTA